MTAPDGAAFRDLNGNGILDPYEGPRLSVTTRVEDLLGRMTLEEKVGRMFRDLIETDQDGELVERGPRIGQEFGRALVDVLSGDTEPDGRGPMSWPAIEEHLPFRTVTLVGVAGRRDSFSAETLSVVGR